MMIKSATSIGSASLQTCSKGRVEALSHATSCVGLSFSYYAVTYSVSGLHTVCSIKALVFLALPAVYFFSH